jgi:adenylate cyclase
MAIAGLLGVFAIPWKRPFSTVIGIAGVASAVVAVNLWLWQREHSVLPVASTLVMLLALLLFTLLTGFLRESRAIRRLSDMFGEYVPRERVELMRVSGEAFSLEGESRELTMLFSDVRNFTTLSEHLPPRELSELMNTLLTALTTVIHDARGTVDKYIGDAIMAFWGAPIANEAHARDAVVAALEMQARMEPLRAQFAARGWPALTIGIGVNTGMVSVGDMGSQFRKAYTVMGDAVNLASRLEELTKLYGVGVLVGEDTRRAVPDLLCREVDRVRVRGRATPVGIYQPLGFEADDALRERLALWHEALSLYRVRRFGDARRLFAELATVPADARLCGVFRDRCDAYEQALLPADWDGAATFTSK